MEPIIPIDLINYDMILIKNNKFLYKDDILNEFNLKIQLEKVKFYYLKDNKSLKIKSDSLVMLVKKLEEMIKDHKGGELAIRSENMCNVLLHFTSNSKINVDGKNNNIKIENVKDIYDKYFDDKNNVANLIFKPIIVKRSNFVWLEIVYCEIVNWNQKNNIMYKKLYSLDNIKIDQKIIL
jgi:hypothetical protein